MSLSRRLDRLESDLPARTAVLHWLAEAKAFDSLEAYAGWLADQSPPAFPLSRVPRQAFEAAGRPVNGRSADTLAEAAGLAGREAYCLVNLIVTLNPEIGQLIETERLRAVALLEMMRAAQLEDELADCDSRFYAKISPERWNGYLEASRDWLARLYVVEEARLILERRYLDGHDCLLGELPQDWTELLHDAEEMVVSWHRIPIDGGTAPPDGETCVGLDLDGLRASILDQAETEAAQRLERARRETEDAWGPFPRMSATEPGSHR